jgi:hypothetical protein
VPDSLTNTPTPASNRILLPAFIGWSPREGSGVFDPVLATGADAAFYDLNADLTVDLEALERALSSEQFAVLVIIHYFGRSDPAIARVRALADRHGVVLVEDLAHGFFSAASGSESGRHGHLSMFSLHKMFPFEDGGLVIYFDPTLVKTQKSTVPELAARILSYDWRRISLDRRNNFLELTGLLSAMPECGVGFELLWPELLGRDVPQTLPVRILGDGRDAIYLGMNDDGFGMVSLYHTLIDRVAVGFDNLNALSSHIINFPVHQDSPPAALRPMIDAFKRHLSPSPTA